jgi:hypothetical protein
MRHTTCWSSSLTCQPWEAFAPLAKSGKVTQSIGRLLDGQSHKRSPKALEVPLDPHLLRVRARGHKGRQATPTPLNPGIKLLQRIRYQLLNPCLAFWSYFVQTATEGLQSSNGAYWRQDWRRSIIDKSHEEFLAFPVRRNLS